MPPEVGYAETSSDIVKPMIRMNTPRIGHDHEIEIGPPLLKPAPKLVKHPARIEMIENEMAKLENPDQRAVQVLAVPELGKVLFVVGKLLRRFSIDMDTSWARRRRCCWRLDPPLGVRP